MKRFFAEFDILSYTSENETYFDFKWHRNINQVRVTIKLRRYSSYYTVMFVIPCTLVTILTLFGKCLGLTPSVLSCS
jgi:hypothetical protein